MSRSKASRQRQFDRMKKNRRRTSRLDLLPNKVAKEEKKFDTELFYMKQRIEKSFPDPVERMRYINALIEAMDEPVSDAENDEPTPAVSAPGFTVIEEPDVSFGDETTIEKHLPDRDCGCGA